MEIIFMTVSDLSCAAVHEQLYAVDVAAVVRSQKDHNLCDFVRLPRAAQRSGGCRLSFELLNLFVAHPEARRVAGSNNGARADGVNPNLSVLKLGRPRSYERAQRSLGRGIYAEGRKPLYRYHRSIDDDDRAIWHQGKR